MSQMSNRPMRHWFYPLPFFACIFFLLFFLVSMAKTRSAQITFAWAPNPEPDICCYRIYKTTTAGQYTFFKEDPDRNHLVWEGRENTATVTAEEACLFVVTAVDRCGNESEPSSEVAYKAADLTSAPNSDLPLHDENGLEGSGVEGNDAPDDGDGSGGAALLKRQPQTQAMGPGVQVL